MKCLIIDPEGTGLDIAVRGQRAGHDVNYFMAPPREQGDALHTGRGLVKRPKAWEPLMDWADLIIVTGNNKYADALAPYFGKGYPIFGSNQKAAALELDRSLGQEVLDDHNIATLPYVVVNSAGEAVEHILATKQPCVMKPWGGDNDKAMTCVAKSVDEAIFTLKKWQRDGNFKGQLMLQEKVDGIEIGISAFFGPGGWSKWIEESFEHKKFLAGELGQNTGEMGTVLRHVTKSKLFDMLLDPLTDYLHLCNYIGDVSVNCIVDKSGTPWPLEFTMRCGWPDFCIRQSVIKGDPLKWILDLVHGQDTLECTEDVAVGVVVAHGDFPKAHETIGTWDGYPVYGVTAKNERHLHFQQIQLGQTVRVRKGKVVREPCYLTAGNYIMVVSGTGDTVSEAADNAYATIKELAIPSNMMYRIDIGKRLEKQLPMLQKLGYARGMQYG